MDFDLFQCGHDGWPAIGVEVAQLNAPYGQIAVIKPLVIGEIGYEKLGEKNLDDFQRVAFWSGMLNGAAGYTYGANGVWEAYSVDKPFQRLKWSFYTWKDGMNFPGSYELGLGAKLLGQYEWWRFEPHQEWVTPHGTTLQEHGPDVAADWRAHNGNFLLPYAAGIPGKVRFIYIPAFGIMESFASPPTILRLEQGIRYRAYFWEPSMGIKVDLGTVERPAPGTLICEDTFKAEDTAIWTEYGSKTVRNGGRLSVTGEMLAVVNNVSEKNLVAAVDARSGANAALILRYHDANNYVAAVYSAKEKAIFLLDRKNGVDGISLGKTPVPTISSDFQLITEVRDGWGAASFVAGQRTYTTPIVEIANTTAGGAGLMHRNDGSTQSLAHFELRQSPTLLKGEFLDRKLNDARGENRGELSGPPGVDMGLGMGVVGGWSDFGRDKIILLDAYRPKNLPYGRDWILVLEASK
jgi:hypothetical protein